MSKIIRVCVRCCALRCLRVDISIYSSVLLHSDGPKVGRHYTKKNHPEGWLCELLCVWNCKFNVQWDQLYGCIATITINIEMPTTIISVYDSVITYISDCVVECITLAVECAQCAVIV